MSDEPVGGESHWVDVGTIAEVTKRRKVVVDVGDEQIFVLAHDGDFFALQNICIHRQRELSKGVVLNGRIVCPGHQWAFDLGPVGNRSSRSASRHTACASRTMSCKSTPPAAPCSSPHHPRHHTHLMKFRRPEAAETS